MQWMRLAPTAGALLLATAVLLAACDDGDRTPSPPADGATNEVITTDDGLHLDARLFAASPERVAILLHQYASDQTSWFPFAQELQAQGTSALTFDFRGYGASEGDNDPGQIDHDVRAAIAFARERGYNGIALVGASMGATAAIVVAVDDPVDGVVSLSAPSRMRDLDATEAIAELRIPVGLIAAEGDLSAFNALQGLSRRADLGDDALLVVAGGAHGTNLLQTANGPEVSAWVMAFLARVWAP